MSEGNPRDVRSTREDRGFVVDAASVHEGDPGEWTRIFQQYKRDVEQLIMFRCPDWFEELSQETFLRALAGRRNYDPTKKPIRSWLLGIAQNVANDHLRRVYRFPEVEVEVEVEVSSRSDPVEDRIDIEAGLQTLRMKEREAFELHQQGYSHAEGAELTGRTEAAMKTDHNRAVNNLRKYFDEKGDGQ